MQAAKRAGTMVSYDLNYRASLWKSIGGKEQSAGSESHAGAFVDVMLGNEEDFTAALGFKSRVLGAHHSGLDAASFKP